jgi:O-antigen ligase
MMIKGSTKISDTAPTRPEGYEEHIHGLNLVDILAVLYLVSSYTLMGNRELSGIALLLALVMLGVLVFRHFTVRALRFPKLFWAPWLFLVFNVVSLFWCRDTSQGIDQISMILSAVTGASAIWLAAHNRSSVKTIVYGMMLASIILIVYSFGEMANLGERGRVAGLVGNANTMGMYLSYPFMLAWCVQGERTGRLRFLGVGFVTYAFLFTGSRKVVVVIAVLVIFLLTYLLSNINSLRMWKRLALISLVLLVMILAGYWNVFLNRASEVLGSNEVVLRVDNLEESREGSSAYTREKMVVVALRLWAESPIVGQGSGQFTVLSGFGMYSHNNYTELLANLGIVGLGLYYILPIAILVKVLRSPRRFFRNFPSWANILVVVIALFALDLAAVTLTFKPHWVFLVSILTLIDNEEGSRVSREGSIPT